MKPNPSYSVALVTALRATGLSQADLARRLGVSRTIISQYAAGNKTPRRAMAERINEALGVKLSPARSITVEEVARCLGIGRDTARRGFRGGQLGAIGVAIPSRSGKRCRYVVWPEKFRDLVHSGG